MEGLPNLLPEDPDVEIGVIDKLAELVFEDSFPVDASIEGLPNLLPDDPEVDDDTQGDTPMTDDDEDDDFIGVNDNEAELVWGPSCPLLANIDACPNL